MARRMTAARGVPHAPLTNTGRAGDGARRGDKNGRASQQIDVSEGQLFSFRIFALRLLAHPLCLEGDSLHRPSLYRRRNSSATQRAQALLKLRGLVGALAPRHVCQPSEFEYFAHFDLAPEKRLPSMFGYAASASFRGSHFSRSHGAEVGLKNVSYSHSKMAPGPVHSPFILLAVSTFPQRISRAWRESAAGKVAA
jgi:hypothetical protein